MGINMTKLDVLSELDEVKVAVGYRHNGQALQSFPANLEQLAEVEVEYETFPGWRTDISGCRSIDDLPENAFNYVKRVEEVLQVPISWVGVGMGREAMAE